MTTSAIRERPIIFSGAMVQAILAGRKCQTRRVVSEFKNVDHPKGEVHHAQSAIYPAREDGWIWWYPDHPGLDEFCKRQYEHGVQCRYGEPGDRLWVRETWGYWGSVETPKWVIYRADADKSGVRWRPSIHMPRKFSRITLEITGVRVERVQAISEADAWAEGAPERSCDTYSAINEHPIDNYRALWDSINAKRGYGWAVNPWVWRVEFKRVSS